MNVTCSFHFDRHMLHKTWQRTEVYNNASTHYGRVHYGHECHSIQASVQTSPDDTNIDLLHGGSLKPVGIRHPSQLIEIPQLFVMQFNCQFEFPPPSPIKGRERPAASGANVQFRSVHGITLRNTCQEEFLFF